MNSLNTFEFVLDSFLCANGGDFHEIYSRKIAEKLLYDG